MHVLKSDFYFEYTAKGVDKAKALDSVLIPMGYKKEEEEATNTFEMHFIELPKFKQKNPDCNTKLEQWLWLIDGSKEEKVKMSAKENEEIDKTVKELDKLSKDPDEIAKYEEREWSIMRYNVEMKTNRELGEKEGRKEGEKKTKEKIVKALKNMNLSIEQIAQAVELTKKEVEAILKTQEN